MQYIILSIHLLFAGAIVFLTLAFVTGAPYVPSGNKALEAMIRLAKIRKGDRVYDLGSGDGRVLFECARLGAVCTGLEINPYLVVYTYIRAFFSPYRTTVSVKWKDFRRCDFQDADIVFIYLIPWKMDTLEHKLHKLSKGTRIITNSFIFHHLTLTGKDEYAHVYAYTV